MRWKLFQFGQHYRNGRLNEISELISNFDLFCCRGKKGLHASAFLSPLIGQILYADITHQNTSSVMSILCLQKDSALDGSQSRRTSTQNPKPFRRQQETTAATTTVVTKRKLWSPITTDVLKEYNIKKKKKLEIRDFRCFCFISSSCYWRFS